MAEKLLKKLSKSLVIKEMQIKTPPRFHLRPIRMVRLTTEETAHAGEDLEQGEQFFIAACSANLHNHFQN